MAKRPPKNPKSAPLRREAEPPLVSGQVRRRDPRQVELPFDPMPERVEPCFAQLMIKPPTGNQWQYEIKWDGYRMAVHVEPNRVRVLSRNGLDWTSRVPCIVKEAAAIGGTMILDGEAVVLDDACRSDFNALQQSFGGRSGRQASDDVILYAFDLLYLDGHDLRSMSLAERRAMLGRLLDGRAGAIRLSETIEAEGDELLSQACALGLEGIIAKHEDRPYRSGRTGDWLKIKCVQSETFIIVGYEPSTTVMGAIASLLLASQHGEQLVYVGSVGTGFRQREAVDLRRQLDEIRTETPAVSIKGKNLVFTEPRLAAEVNYRAWTSDGQLRHASYKGLRDEGDAARGRSPRIGGH